MRLVLLLLGVVTLALAAPASADPPTATPFSDTFPDVDPCTGGIHTVTIAGTSYVHSHGDRIVVRSERTITTAPTGYVGHGTDTFVDNGRTLLFRLTDILRAPNGNKIKAQFIIVLDLATGTSRVERGGLTCLGG